jgi:hypothetical protein
MSVVVCGWVSAGGWCTIDSKEMSVPFIPRERLVIWPHEGIREQKRSDGACMTGSALPQLMRELTSLPCVDAGSWVSWSRLNDTFFVNANNRLSTFCLTAKNFMVL